MRAGPRCSTGFGELTRPSVPPLRLFPSVDQCHGVFRAIYGRWDPGGHACRGALCGPGPGPAGQGEGSPGKGRAAAGSRPCKHLALPLALVSQVQMPLHPVSKRTCHQHIPESNSIHGRFIEHLLGARPLPLMLISALCLHCLQSRCCPRCAKENRLREVQTLA